MNRLSRTSNDMLNAHAQNPSAGYNRDSFFMQGREMPVRDHNEVPIPIPTRERTTSATGSFGQRQSVVEDEGWDVYNDFNNQGPRYSDAFGSGLKSVTSNSNGYTQLPNTRSDSYARSLPPKSEAGTNTPDVELVTVPALGPEWKKSELDDMRKATRQEEKAYTRKKKFMAWWRDEYACCCGFAGRKILIFFLFALCCVIGIVLAITLPRVPGFSFNAEKPLTNSTASTLPTEFSRDPANFTFPALINIQIDTSSNIIPLTIKHIHADVFDLDTDVKIGSGDYGKLTIPAKAFKPLSVEVLFNYIAPNDTDTTWLTYYDACKNPIQYADGVRPGFNLRLVFTVGIAGMIKSIKAGTQISKISCPFQLPSSAG